MKMFVKTWLKQKSNLKDGLLVGSGGFRLCRWLYRVILASVQWSVITTICELVWQLVNPKKFGFGEVIGVRCRINYWRRQRELWPFLVHNCSKYKIVEHVFRVIYAYEQLCILCLIYTTMYSCKHIHMCLQTEVGYKRNATVDTHHFFKCAAERIITMTINTKLKYWNSNTSSNVHNNNLDLQRSAL